MFGSKSQPQTLTKVAPEPAPPTVEELHAQASGSTAYALTTFTGLITDLEEANTDFDSVEARTTAEIQRLMDLRADAVAQRRKNLATIEAVQGLMGTQQ